MREPMKLLGRKQAKTVENVNTTLITDRLDYRTAVNLIDITGQCGLNKYLNTIKKNNDSSCPDCGHAEETVAHFLGQCPATAQLRGHNFNNYYLSLNDIFDYHHITTIVNFANHTKRLKLEPQGLDISGAT